MNCANCGDKMVKLIGEEGVMCKECWLIVRKDGTEDRSEMRMRVKVKHK